VFHLIGTSEAHFPQPTPEAQTTMATVSHDRYPPRSTGELQSRGLVQFSVRRASASAESQGENLDLTP